MSPGFVLALVLLLNSCRAVVLTSLDELLWGPALPGRDGKLLRRVRGWAVRASKGQAQNDTNDCKHSKYRDSHWRWSTNRLSSTPETDDRVAYASHLGLPTARICPPAPLCACSQGRCGCPAVLTGLRRAALRCSMPGAGAAFAPSSLTLRRQL